MYYKISKNDILSIEILEKIKQTLQNNGVLICPTESSYLIGGNALDKKAVASIYRIKNRLQKKPLPIVVHNKDFAFRIAYFGPVAKILANKFWPGPLTMILKVKTAFLQICSGETTTIGMRVPYYSLLNQVLEAVKKPLVSTSANISGKHEPYQIPDEIRNNSVLKQIGFTILDAGKLKVNPPSTVIDVTNDEVVLKREGPISFNQILNLLK